MKLLLCAGCMGSCQGTSVSLRAHDVALKLLAWVSKGLRWAVTEQIFVAVLYRQECHMARM